MTTQAPLKLLITTPWSERLGGAENMLFTFLRHVNQSRVDPFVVFLQRGLFEAEVAGLGIKTAIIEAGRLRNVAAFLRAARQLAELFRRERPDLVLNWSAKTQVYGAAAALLPGSNRRMVWWQHGIPSDHWLDRLATLLPALAIGCSSEHSATAQRSLWPRRRTFVVHPGAEPVERPPECEIQRIRAELEGDASAPVIGIVGRLQPWKGQHHLLDALAVLRSRGLITRGLVVGGDAWDLSPGYDRELRERTIELGLAVTFTGQVSNPVPYIAALDVLVNASAEEPFGLVILEAMALGVPVVAVDAAGPREIIEDGHTGLLVRDASPDRLASALETLIRDPSRRQAIAEAGNRRFREKFGAAKMAERLEERLEEVARDA